MARFDPADLVLILIVAARISQIALLGCFIVLVVRECA